MLTLSPTRISQTHATVMEVPKEQQFANDSQADSQETVAPLVVPPHRRLGAYLNENVDSGSTLLQMTLYCFMTGFTSSVSFTATWIWCGFITGGTIQLSLALARLVSGPRPEGRIFEVPDRQALCSLLSFLLGTSIGRIGDKLNAAKTRWWLMFTTVLQGLLLMAAALCAHYSGEPSYAATRGDPTWVTPLGFAALGFASASLGLHGIVSKRLNTQFGTAVVLTTVWVELINDPKLFFRQAVISRDHRIIAVSILFVGGFVGRALIGVVGAAGTLGIGAGLRVLIAFTWLLCKKEVAKKK